MMDISLDNFDAKDTDIVNDDNLNIPMNIIRGKVHCNVMSDLCANLSVLYSSAFYTDYTFQNTLYSHNYKKYKTILIGESNEITGSKHDNRFILTFKINKAFLNNLLRVNLYGSDILSKPFVENTNSIKTLYSSQVGGLFGVGLTYKIH